MSRNAIVPRVNVEGLATKTKKIKDVYPVKEGRNDVYFVIYEDEDENESKELVYTYEESDIIPAEGIKTIDFSEFKNCKSIVEINGIDYAICTELNGKDLVIVRLPEKERVFSSKYNENILLKGIGENYILIDDLNSNNKNKRLYNINERQITHTLAKSIDIDKLWDYYVLSGYKRNGEEPIRENAIYDSEWTKILQIDGNIDIYEDKLVQISSEGIKVYELRKKNPPKYFNRESWHTYEPMYIHNRGEIITFEQGRICIFDLDFNMVEKIEIPNPNGTIKLVENNGDSLIIIYCDNITIFYDLKTKAFLQYSEIWRFPYDAPSSFIGINSEEPQIYHIHDKRFQEIISINIAETDIGKGLSEPVYDSEDGCIFAFKNIDNKWILINTITGEYIEKEEYTEFFAGVNCICGIRTINENQEKYVVDIYDFDFQQKVTDLDYQKYGIKKDSIFDCFHLQLIGDCIFFRGRYDIGTSQDLEPEYIFGPDGEKIFGFDRNRNSDLCRKKMSFKQDC